MRIIINSTDFLTTIDGVPVRLWWGTTEGGGRCDVFVHRIISADPVAQAEMDIALKEQAEPEELRKILGVPLRFIP